MLFVFSFLKVGQHFTKHFVMIIIFLARQLHRIVNQVNFKDYMPKTFDKNYIYHIYLRGLQQKCLASKCCFDRLQFGNSPDSVIKLQLRIQTEHFVRRKIYRMQTQNHDTHI